MMTAFLVLFDEWNRAAAAAARANSRLCRQLDACGAGVGPAPGPSRIARTRRLADEADRRLADLRSLLLEQRGQVALI